jgi:predicted nucleic acid-binding protein
MSLSHLLDTSVYCQPIKPRPLPGVERRWRELGDDALATSVICEAELLYGLQLKQSSRLNALYEELLKGRLAVLPIDSATAGEFSRMKAIARSRGFAASDFDFLIAATAKAHDLTLATLNVRHFSGIEGLTVEDWSAD